MIWLLAAVGGHLLNAAAFIIDKSLLSAAFKRSGTYATVIGVFSSTILVLLPWTNPDLPLDTWITIGIFGSVFVLALWAFFEALSRGETSRVVPVVGSLIPVFTLIDSTIFLQERLALRILIGLAVLLCATILLTRGGHEGHRLNAGTIGLCVFAAFMFAASSVSGKYAFDHAPFLDAFVLSRVFSIFLALCIPLFSSNVRAELRSMFHKRKKGSGPKPKHVGLMAIGQVSGALGFIGVQYSISLGSATIVNALQAVQYAAIVLIAWFGGPKLAALLHEDRSRKTMIVKGAAIVLVAIGLTLVGLPTDKPLPQETRYGFTWSVPYARSLGIDPQKGLELALKDLKPEHVRIPAYWSEIEKERGVYDFAWLDAQMETAAAHGTKVTLVVGSRVPRWPECWEPDWVNQLSDLAERNLVQMAYVRKTYERYANHPALVGWQVENEAFFDFYAACHGMTRSLVLEEMRYVRGEEIKRGGARRPVVTTDSGEWSLWLGFAGEVDALGVSVYRSIATEWFGTLQHWYFTPTFYSGKAQLMEPIVGPVFVSELQMEPWTLKAIQNTPLEDQYRTFDIDQMRDSFQYAKKLGMPAVDFWGAEWWLWMKEKQNVPEFWEEAREFFESERD